MKPWLEYTDPSNWHPAANIFPLMSGAELKEMADDIKANGQKNPVILLNDKVLDGRNRLLACQLAGVRPSIESRNPDKLGSPVAWVLSQNLQRRQLTATQRAFIAVEALKLFEIEAKERQKMGKEKIPDPAQAGQARDQAAKSLDVNPRYVQDAKAITEKSPEVAAQAKAGKVSLADAKKLEPFKKTNPKLYAAVLAGKTTLREAKPKPAKKDLRERYSEPDFFARIGRMLAGTLLRHPLLDELLKIQKKDWTPEAEHGFRCLMKNLDDVSERAHFYANGLNKVLREYHAKKAA